MSIGLPVITTNKGALGELVENNKTGLLTNLDSSEIVSAVLSLVNDMGKAKTLGERAKVVSEKFSEDKIGKALEDFLMTKIRKVEN